MTRALLLLVACLCLGCASKPLPYVSPCDRPSNEVYAVLKLYNSQGAKNKYPHDLKELKQFAASKGLPLHLQAFSKIDYRYSEGVYWFSYTCKADGFGGSMSGGQTFTIN